MSSLRERLATKAKRRAVVPVSLGEPSEEDTARLALAQAEMLRAIGEGEPTDELEAEITALRDRYEVQVGFTALDPNDFEKVQAAYQTEGAEDAGMDWKKALPVLAALCADDEDLQDDEWWAGELASGRWNQGERLALWQALLHVNSTAPNPYIPKG